MLSMKCCTRKFNRAERTGFFFLAAAAAIFFVSSGLAITLLLFFVALCVAACFFPRMNFLGPVISRGRTGKNSVAITFDDGPSAVTTLAILELLDRHSVKATFFVSGVHALDHPELIDEIVRRGHGVGNHSLNHDPFVMLKSYRVLYREVSEAQRILRKMGIETTAFRPPVGIINPKLHPVLNQMGLVCMNFSCRAWDAGNFRIRNLAFKIMRKVKDGDIILLHDTAPRRLEDTRSLLREIDAILTGISKKGLRVIPLNDLIRHEYERREKNFD
jgi:peptidoglycan-N-acetylglucosamine deacetylase